MCSVVKNAPFQKGIRYQREHQGLDRSNVHYYKKKTEKLVFFITKCETEFFIMERNYFLTKFLIKEANNKFPEKKFLVFRGTNFLIILRK